MPSIKSPYKVIWFTKIADIAQQDWDNLALPLPTPFLEWEWLYQLEEEQILALNSHLPFAQSKP